MKLKKKKVNEEMHTGALNDILFILLFFFLIVSTLANPNVMKVNNPKGKSEGRVKQNIMVSIDKENKIYIAQKETPEVLLDSMISFEVNKLKATVDTPSVVINADTISYTGGFFKVLGAAKKAGAKVVANVKN